MTFGEKIQKLRKEAGLSQEELSYQLGVSRQAVSKWERDSGYPETEKIIRMSKLFHVTLDYLLNEDTKQQPADGQDEAGFYVSAETAEGFLSFQKRKLQKTGIAIGLFIGGLAFTFWDSEAGILLYMLSAIIGILLLFSIKLSDHPYRRLWKEPLLFDDAIKAELAAAYAASKPKIHACILTGIALIALGLLFLPLLVPPEWVVMDSIALGGGMLLTGAGTYLCIYMGGLMRAYRLLVMNDAYQEKKKG